MVQIQQRTRLLTLVAVLVAIAAVLTLALSLRVQAADLEIWNVYVGDAAQAEKFAKENSADTGWTDGSAMGTSRHQVVAITGDAIAAINSKVKGEASNYEPDQIRINVWILKDTVNTTSDPATTTMNYLLGASTQIRNTKTNRDLMIYITGVKGYGTTTEKNGYPVIKAATTNAYAYMNQAVTLKNITIRYTKSGVNRLFLAAHEFVADEGVQIYGQNGSALSNLMCSSYNNASAATNVGNHYNGVGEYGSYHEESFAGKVTLKSGEWGEVGASCGHPSVGHTDDAKYDFTYDEKADYYFDIDGATVSKLVATRTYDTQSSSSVTKTVNRYDRAFLGGLNCTLHYDLHSGYVGTVTAGPYGYPVKTESSGVPTDVSRQYYSVEVNTYDGVTVGTIQGRFGLANAAAVTYGLSENNPVMIFGDLTYNLYGGTFESGFCVRPVQGAVVTVGRPDYMIMLGKVKVTIGDPETGKGPDLKLGSNNVNFIVPVFGCSLGLSSQGTTAQFIDEPMFKKEYKAPADQLTIGEWAKTHAGVEVAVYGGSVDKMQVCLCNEYSLGTKYIQTGGTVGTVELNQAFYSDAGTAEDRIGYTAGLEMNLTGGTLQTIKTATGVKGIEGNVTVNATGVTYAAAPDLYLVLADKPLVGDFTLNFKDCTMPALNTMKATTNITGNLNVTLDGCTVNGSVNHGTASVPAKITGNVSNTVTNTTITGRFAAVSADAKVDGTVINNITNVTMSDIFSCGSDYVSGSIGKSTVIGGGIVNTITDLGTAAKVEDKLFYAGGTWGTVNANEETGYAVSTTLNSTKEWNGGICAAARAATVNGDVILDIENVKQNTSRHLIIGNLHAGITTADEAIITGNVEAILRQGTVGAVYIGDRSNVACQHGIATNCIIGDVTFTVEGGSVGTINKGVSHPVKEKDSDGNEVTVNYPCPTNISGTATVVIDTTKANVTLRGSIPVYVEGSNEIDVIKIIAGDYILYKTGSSSRLNVTELVASEEKPLRLAHSTDNKTEWEGKVDHLTIAGTDVADLVSVQSGPNTALVSEVRDGSTVWTTVNYTFSLESISRTVKLGDTYAVRYLLKKDTVNFFGLDKVTAAYTVTTNGKADETVTVTLLDGAEDGDYSDYYYFLVEGIFAKNYDRAEITVTVTVRDTVYTLEDSIAQALDDLAQDESYADLANAIVDFAKALEAYAYLDVKEPEITVTAPTDWLEKQLAEATAWADELTPGVTAAGISLTAADTITIHFWVEAEDIGKLTAATLTTPDGEKNILNTLKERGDGMWSVSYECGAGDLATMLLLDLGGDVTFNACPLSYAKSLAKLPTYEYLGNAIIEYAYYVQTVLVEGN